MTISASSTGRLAEPVIVADDVPPDVQDCGKVRMGGAIHTCWLTWEILQYLPGLMRFWPSTSC